MILFIVNRRQQLKPDQTTTRLVHACLTQGRTVAVADIFSLAVRSQREVRARAVLLHRQLSSDEICQFAGGAELTEIRPDQLELVVVRTSPGRDLDYSWAHRMALHAALLLRDGGTLVVNDPVGLERASSKLYGACFPRDITPRTLVAHSWPPIVEFMESSGGPVVVKPLLGSQGRDVFLFSRHDQTNLRHLCELLGRTGYLVIQEFLPEAVDGDKRVLLLDGRVLSVGSQEAIVHRVPRHGEFRSNVALGAEVRPTVLTPGERRVAETAAAILVEDGIRFSGLDLVGEKVIEVNVYSTGGIVDAEKFYDVDFAHVVIEKLAEPITA